MHIHRLKLVCCLFLLPCSIALAASFDCTKAGTPVEKAICDDPGLGQLDQDVALAYKMLLNSLHGNAAQRLRDEQRDWLKTRDQPDALNDVLRTRRAVLRTALNALSSATDDAFDALLSMPAAKPAEGEWDTIKPDDFEPADESALIRYLARQVKRGADVNAYRHYGTLLHHALRAGLDATSLWLLAHGADPAMRIEGSNDDALAIAIQYGRWRPFDALLKARPYASLAPRALAEAVWPTALAAPDKVGYMLSHKLPLPDGALGQCMLEIALNSLDLPLVLALPERTPLQADKAKQKWETGPMLSLQFACKNRDGEYPTAFSTVKLAKLTDAQLEAADARVSVPVLPYLLPAVVTVDDARRLFKLKLRRPFEQAAFTRRVLNAVLWRAYAPGVTRALLQQIPPQALKAALDDDPLLTMWFRRFSEASAADFAWALNVPSGPALNSHAGAVLAGMEHPDQGIPNPSLAANWPMLLARLHGPLKPGKDMPLLLTNGLPLPLWPVLFKLGYRPTQDELDMVLHAATEARLRQIWPILSAALPELPGRAVTHVLAPHLAAGCNETIDQADVDKVKYLLAQGVRAPKGLVLCAAALAESEQQVYAALQATGVLAPAPASGQAPPIKLVAETVLPCRIEVAALRSAFASGRVGPDGSRVRIDDVQAIDFPGEPVCALVVSGSTMSNIDSGDEEPGSFNAGPTPELHPSCADPAIIKEVWRQHGGKVDVSTFDVNGFTTIDALARDAGSGRRYYAATEYHGKCGHEVMYLAQWVNTGGHQQLKTLEPDQPAARAYARQCAEGPGCLGQAAGGTDAATEPAWSTQMYQDFIDRQFTSQRAAFVQAVLAMDSARLQAELKAGVMPGWRAAAMIQVAASALAPQEKRRRMAWLLDNPEQVIEIMQTARHADNQFPAFGLIVTWLPESQWDALIEKITDRSSMLAPLRGAAIEQGKRELACRLSRAFQRTCRVAANDPEEAQ